MDEKILETAAMVLHGRRHPAGSGQICDECRDDARAVLAVTQDPPPVEPDKPKRYGFSASGPYPELPDRGTDISAR